MERLWAPWRSVYLTDLSEKEDVCVFCELQKEDGDDFEKLVLYRGKSTFVLMNRYPYNNGHLLVLPRAHSAHFRELDSSTFLELNALLAASVDIVESVFLSHGANIGMNLGAAAGAGIPGHMHYHIVPRWRGDTNFMPVLGETKVISQELGDTWKRLRPAFSALKL